MIIRKVKNKNFNFFFQKKGICLKIRIKTPRKPNSAKRATVLFRKKKQKYNAFIPGISHNLKKFFVILVFVGNIKDLPQINLYSVRGKYDLNEV
jgi:small subunit ribosomal protein S12